MTIHPRVLHVGFNPIGSPTNTGLTLGSMFRSWPRDHLLQLYTMSRQGVGVDQNVMMAPPSSAPIDGAIRRMMGSRLPAPVTDGLNTAISRRGVQLPLRARARLAATTLNDLGPVWTRGRWVNDIKAWEPQVIHSLLGGVRITRLVVSLSRRLDLPVVPHFMDDWMGTLFTDGQLRGFARREVNRLLDAVLERSPVCLTIGYDMQAEYERKLGRECVVVGNSVDFDAFEGLRVSSAPSTGVRTIRYIGGLHLGRVGVLRSVGHALNSQAPRTNPWRLRISVPQVDIGLAQELEAEIPAIQVGDTLRPDEVPAALVNSEALLFVESADTNIARFTRLSVSTKVPEYLAARRPVLVVGPVDQASVRALMRSGAAHYAGPGHVRAQLDRGLESLTGALDSEGTEPIILDSIRHEFGTAPTQDRLRTALLQAAGLA
jgi:hypothetical protein